MPNFLPYHPEQTGTAGAGRPGLSLSGGRSRARSQDVERVSSPAWVGHPAAVRADAQFITGLGTGAGGHGGHRFDASGGERIVPAGAARGGLGAQSGGVATASGRGSRSSAWHAPGPRANGTGARANAARDGARPNPAIPDRTPSPPRP